VLCLAWSPDAKYLVSGSMDGQILVWHADSAALKGVCKVRYFGSLWSHAYHAPPGAAAAKSS
jgi:WD40 repeat protein